MSLMVVDSEEVRWREKAACLGSDPELFIRDKGYTYTEGRAVCAECPVAARCLEAAFALREKHGLWGGASERQRRLLRVAYLQRSHSYRQGCDCPWCEAVDQHLGSLDSPQPVNINGRGATHGKKSTYARGCRCTPCSIAISPTGKRLVRAGYDVLGWWRQWFGDELERGEGDARYVRAKLLAELDASEAEAA